MSLGEWVFLTLYGYWLIAGFISYAMYSIKLTSSLTPPKSLQDFGNQTLGACLGAMYAWAFGFAIVPHKLYRKVKSL